MIAALFVAKNGAYYSLDGVDPWDEERDARKYDGPWPVIAHPPCSAWCRLAPINDKRYGHRIGSDGGCFKAALDAVNQWGGVLEHPAGSYAWAAFNLPVPVIGAWRRDAFCDGWVCEVSQAAYGHRARKMTWLYYRGEGAPPPCEWRRPKPTAQVSHLSNHRPTGLPQLTKKQAKATPPAFRDLLISIAESAKRKAGAA